MRSAYNLISLLSMKSSLRDALTLGQSVADVVVQTFTKLNVKSGKPTVRSNGVKEWTVLAGLVAVIDEECVPICIATGVKALSTKYRRYSKGTMVHDLHAEVLCLRLFNYFLVEEIDNADSKLVEKYGDGKFRIKQDVELALYVSEPPCGDASMKYIAGDRKPWVKRQKVLRERSDNDDVGKVRGKDDYGEAGMVRGRNYYDNVGVVRTKPGRADSEITLSKSCSDKLCLKQLTGITNSFTARLFPDGIFLKYLVLQKGKIDHADFDRCFFLRIQPKLLLEPSIHSPRLELGPPLHCLRLLEYGSDSYPFHKPDSAESVPSPLSLLHVVPNKTQVLNNGVKNGSFVKNMAPKPSGQSFICNRQIYLQCKQLLDTDQPNYHKFKLGNGRREKMKNYGKALLGGWQNTEIDDFEFI